MAKRVYWGYLFLVGVPLLVLAAILETSGIGSLSSPARPIAQSKPGHSDGFSLVVQIAVILIASKVGAKLFRSLGQPEVVGEMAAGLFLGPSVLGWFAPGLSSALFPPSSLPMLGSLSQLGLVLFLFMVGLSTNSEGLQNWKHACVLISHVSIAVPFLSGSVLAFYLFPDFAGAGVSLVAFALFLGAAMSITAFPVLARILIEQKLIETRMGTLAITCAAVDDVTGWCILAYIVALVRASRSSIPVEATLLGCLAFVAFMLCVVRPLAGRLTAAFVVGRISPEAALLIVLLFLLASSVSTEFLGIHMLFGAFLAGAILPKEKMLVDFLRGRLESVTLILLLPLFFVVTGLRTHVELVHGAAMWQVLAYIIAVAVLGKMGGSMVAARWTGLNWRDSAAIGTLLNTRGLMELVILNLALDLGIITPALFTVMVIMALVTTVMTSPLLRWLHAPSLLRTELAAVKDCSNWDPAYRQSASPGSSA